MRKALPVAAFVALGLCAGCAGPIDPPAGASAGSCLGLIQQAGQTPLNCGGWPPRGEVVTNPNGHGPQIELWGPPGGGGSAGGAG
jgi:hypothetical protein